MLEKRSNIKQVIVHIGPHKTGSTSIQNCLSENAETLTHSDVLFFHNDETHASALLLARQEFDIAEKKLRSLASTISGCRESTVILSQEDFCGELPGRSRRRAVYPKLTRNLRIISRSLRPHRVKFVFFERDKADWLKSCYYQHLKHRNNFSNLDAFIEHYGENLEWGRVLEKPQDTFGEKFFVLPYKASLDSGIKGILSIAGKPMLQLPKPPCKKNSSPTMDQINFLERINALSSFKSTSWFSKSLVMKSWKPRASTCFVDFDFSADTSLAQIALPSLTKRAENRVKFQKVEDILPPRNVDLSCYIFDILPLDVPPPTVSRRDMSDQSTILDYHLRGKSHLAKLNALTISYLRRDTSYTEKARYLFHRIWREYGFILINELSTRWLISTLQTFLDHGENEAQRLIGASGYFYANLMKIYEGERSIEGLDQAAIYKESNPQTPNKFNGLDRYRVGGTDLLLNTNSRALDLAFHDDVAGLVLVELLLRVKASANVFTRMDATRKEMGISEEDFSDTWSFFEPK